MEESERQMQADDYARIGSVIEFLRENQADQPGLSELAVAVHLSEPYLQRLFARWAGISPKRFFQCLSVEHAKGLLAASADMLSGSYGSGLSGVGRSHDLFVNLEAVTPGEFKAGGAGVEIGYGFHPTRFGICLVGVTARGICYLGFVAEQTREEMLQDLRRRWPRAEIGEDFEATGVIVGRIFGGNRAERPSFKLFVRGTNFQIGVWRALLQIPEGKVSNYSSVARWVGKPGASRAVGSAIGANPIAWLIPCHRVLRADGQLGGYHWGLTRKQAFLIQETG